jgi:hypothetical protein
MVLAVIACGKYPAKPPGSKTLVLSADFAVKSSANLGWRRRHSGAEWNERTRNLEIPGLRFAHPE